MIYPILTPEEAAEFVQHGMNVGVSGFTAPGCPKVVPPAIAAKARREHEAGREFKINLFTGASTSDYTDGELSRADALNYRTPYQSLGELRKHINAGDVHYNDRHLSELSQEFRYGYYGKMDIAIVEVQSIDDNGDMVLGTGLGNTPTWLQCAEKVIIEINDMIPESIHGMHDIYVPLDPPARREIPIYKPSDRAGKPVAHVDPKKVLGVVKTSMPLGVTTPFTPVDEVTAKIGEYVCEFLVSEMKHGRMPKSFLPIQSGVGNIANAVLNSLEASTDIPAFEMYTEVVQDSVLKLLESGRCKFASTCSMTFSRDAMTEFFQKPELHDKLLMRPSEISNNPEVIRRIGVVSMNTAIECDLYGHINSSHVSGSRLMNGIGGSGDFIRNAYLSIFTCPSIAKGGVISSIVPFVSHQDSSEHDVNIIVTEQGVADLRGKSPAQRAECIIENCAHPDYKQLLWDYLKISKMGQTRHNLTAAFAMHDTLARKGDMHLTDFAEYVK